MDIATGCAAARQLFGLSHYKAGQLQTPCSAFEEVPEPRPTNPLARSGCYLILSAYGLKHWAVLCRHFIAIYPSINRTDPVLHCSITPVARIRRPERERKRLVRSL